MRQEPIAQFDSQGVCKHSKSGTIAQQSGHLSDENKSMMYYIQLT